MVGASMNRFTSPTLKSMFDLVYVKYRKLPTKLLIKMLMDRELPENLETFIYIVYFYFGGDVYDIKHLMRNCNGLNGGLERVAKALGVDYVAGKSHQVGSDSLLIMQAFLKLLKMADMSLINRLIEEEEGLGL
ncbi:probable CCR4-associated factor 1 homolog 11 [Camellia sinensis]|uniref:probable CCR4-associated factor 1 homolog 11 n=1 Tax=Camellia sinensis TaxID=4442 RepID=UPI001035BFE4|nr:probable CCR4-associated factor 1 homolog 11 [Camellia sinensis]